MEIYIDAAEIDLSHKKSLAENSKDRFGFTEMLAIDGLNLLDCFRGVEAYTDIIDYPEEANVVEDLCKNYRAPYKNKYKLIKK